MATTIRSARQLGTGSPDWVRRTRVVVAGAGAAGLAAATQLADAGVDTVLLTGGTLLDSSTAVSTGRIDAWAEPRDGGQALSRGFGLADPRALGRLLTAAPRVHERMTDLMARCGADRPGRYETNGFRVQRSLAAAVRTMAGRLGSSLRVEPGMRGVDVLTDEDGRVAGLRVLGADGQIGDWLAPVVLLATGGPERFWQRTSAPAAATGDAAAMALRVGARLRDMEFVACAPTAVDLPPELALPLDPAITLGRELRRAGARLVDEQGRPALAGLGEDELKPSDELAMAVHDWLVGHTGARLLLDGTVIGESSWATPPLSATLAACRARGIDPTRDPVPVRPAVQTMIGGISVGADGASTVPGLYAAGEAACTGARGAAGPSNAGLIEALAGGFTVGAQLARVADSFAEPGEPATRAPGGCVPAAARGRVTGTSRAAGLRREHTALARSIDELVALPTGAPLSGAALTATNLRLVGAAVLAAALARPESRGWHRRDDHPGDSEKWVRTIGLELDGDGRLRVRSTPVATERGGRSAAQHTEEQDPGEDS